MAARRLDDIDLRILTELQRDGRASCQQLSQLVGLSPRPCLERVRRLERERVIIGYTTRVDVRRLVNVVVVVAQISLSKQGRDIRLRFEERLRKCSEVLECFEVSGAFDYVAKIICPTLASYQELSETWLDDPALHVDRIVSNIVLRPIKDAGVYPVAIARSGAGADQSDEDPQPAAALPARKT
jgi:DNA-binding Lrp family transcriptional regulator